MLDVGMATKPLHNLRRTTRKIARVCTLALIILLTMSCSGNKPLCPIMPSYPGSRVIDSTEQDITRVTLYTARASSIQIFDYYTKNLVSDGWIEQVRSPNLISFDYYSSDNFPPFGISIIIENEVDDVVHYRVALKISAPGASWRTHCTSLRP